MSGLAGVVVGAEQDQIYHLKKITFFNREIAVLLQNLNGPCPLLAICNALILNNRLTIHPDKACISLEDLIQELAALILDTPPPAGVDAATHQYQLQDAIQVLPSLAQGLDVNVRFCKGVTGFEYTQQFAPFDLLGIDLLHGWLVDPENTDVVSCLSSHFSTHSRRGTNETRSP